MSRSPAFGSKVRCRNSWCVRLLDYFATENLCVRSNYSKVAKLPVNSTPPKPCGASLQIPFLPHRGVSFFLLPSTSLGLDASTPLCTSVQLICVRPFHTPRLFVAGRPSTILPSIGRYSPFSPWLVSPPQRLVLPSMDFWQRAPPRRPSKFSNYIDERYFRRIRGVSLDFPSK